MSLTANNQSAKVDSIQIITSAQINENNNEQEGATDLTPGSGLFMSPSEVEDRPADITDCIVTAANEYGKFQWTTPAALGDTILFGDLGDVTFTSLQNNQAVVYNSATENWINTSSLSLTGITLTGTLAANAITSTTTIAGNAVSSTTSVTGATLTDGTASLASGALTGATRVTYTKGTVTQLTSITTAVSINNPVGVITTFAAATATDDVDSFTVNNTSVVATSTVQAFVQDYAGVLVTDGVPVVVVTDVAVGSFVINIANVGVAALDGALTIGYIVN